MTSKIATAALLAAIGMAAGAPAFAADAPTVEKCYGVALHGHNDCAAGAHSCAGQATKDRDPKSFVALPMGACGKIAGGKLSPV